MNYFKAYLSKHRLNESSATIYAYYVNRFINWLRAKQLTIAECTHKIIIEYLADCRGLAWSQRTLRLNHTALRKYFDYLAHDPNPAQFHLRPSEQTVPSKLFEESELLLMYKSYPNQNPSDKIIAGLLVFQALRKKEILNLERSDIDVDNATINIDPSPRFNGRRLKLQACQIALLISFIDQSPNDQLFDSSKMTYQMTRILKSLKQRSAKLNQLRELRSSVIINWLDHHNLREVQYMAGHRYVSSTERYMRTQLEDLQRALEQYHPLNE